MNFQKELNYIVANMGGYILPKAMLAGGAITSAFTKQKIADFDLYFRSKEDFTEALHVAYDHNLWCVSRSSRAITLAQGDTVFQLMHFKWFADPAAIFDSFDFTCCMAALDVDSKEFTFHPRFIADTSKRELVFNHATDYPLASGLRVIKYQGRGYTISKRELAKLLATCAMRGVASWDDLADQIGGKYGDAVTLDSSKPFTAENVSLALDLANMEETVDAAGMPCSADDALALIFPPKKAEA